MRICNVVQGHQCGSVVTKFWKAGPRSFTRLHWIHLLFLSHVQTWKTFCCITIAAFFLLLYINWFMWAKSIYKIPCTGNVESSSWQFHLIDHHLYIVRVFFPWTKMCHLFTWLATAEVPEVFVAYGKKWGKTYSSASKPFVIRWIWDKLRHQFGGSKFN